MDFFLIYILFHKEFTDRTETDYCSKTLVTWILHHMWGSFFQGIVKNLGKKKELTSAEFNHRFEHISIIHFSQYEPFHHLLSQTTSSLFQSASKKSIKDNHSLSIRQYCRTRTAVCRVPAANCQHLRGSILCACVSPPRRFLFLCSSAKRSAHWGAGAPLFLGKNCPRLVLKRCAGWEHVDLNTFSGDMPRPLLSGVSLGELESLAPC